eukprot:1153633-Pelagomonas_calceolata.AAC.1
MSTGRTSPIVVIVYILSLFIGVASELSHARPVIGPVADITDIHIKIRGFRVQGFFATRILADLTAGTFNSCPGQQIQCLQGVGACLRSGSCSLARWLVGGKR